MTLALATFWLGWQTRMSERARRRESQLIDAHPLAVSHLDHDFASTPPWLRVKIENRSNRAVVDVEGTILDPAGSGNMSPGSIGVVDEGSYKEMEFELAGFLELPVADVEILSHGLLGQRIVQRYRWSVVEVRAGADPGSEFRLIHVEVIPTDGKSVVYDPQW
jgi:hypothetical protein